MRNKLIASAVLAGALAVAAAPLSAEARQHRVRVCDNPRSAANTGTVVGAVGGGLLGNAIAGHGNKTTGTLVGAGVGAVAGHQVAKANAKHRCRYVYR